MAKGSKGTGSNGAGTILAVVGLLLLMVHVMVIAEDVQAVIEDPNKENKPGEVLKLVVDLSRYLPK